MAAVLFSGGRDSALAALLLADWYDVRLVTVTAGVRDVGERAASAAAALDLPHETVDVERAVYVDAVDRMDADGFPRHGIETVHEHALERVADRYAVVADGTRRDDRAPTIDRSTARSLEDRHAVDYVRPLAGFGRSAIDDLADEHLDVETGPSEATAPADYETELRALLAEREGEARVAEVFPEHTQSRVVGRR